MVSESRFYAQGLYGDDILGPLAEFPSRFSTSNSKVGGQEGLGLDFKATYLEELLRNQLKFHDDGILGLLVVSKT